MGRILVFDVWEERAERLASFLDAQSGHSANWVVTRREALQLAESLAVDIVLADWTRSEGVAFIREVCQKIGRPNVPPTILLDTISPLTSSEFLADKTNQALRAGAAWFCPHSPNRPARAQRFKLISVVNSMLFEQWLIYGYPDRCPFDSRFMEHPDRQRPPLEHVAERVGGWEELKTVIDWGAALHEGELKEIRDELVRWKDIPAEEWIVYIMKLAKRDTPLGSIARAALQHSAAEIQDLVDHWKDFFEGRYPMFWRDPKRKK